MLAWHDTTNTNPGDLMVLTNAMIGIQFDYLERPQKDSGDGIACTSFTLQERPRKYVTCANPVAKRSR